MSLETILEQHTVNEKYMEDGFGDEEFPHTMRRVQIIELKAELEAKRDLLGPEHLIPTKRIINLLDAQTDSLKPKGEESTCLVCTGLFGELEHLKIEK